MFSAKIPGNELCYLDAVRRVSIYSPMDQSDLHAGSLGAPDRSDAVRLNESGVVGAPGAADARRWVAWGHSALAVLVTGVLIGLGVANVATHARWHEVEDGVLWSARPEGVVAEEVAPGSAGATAGIQP